MKQRWCGVVERSSGRPLLVTIMADGTPMKPMVRACRQVDDFTRLIRAGKRACEFFVMRGFIMGENCFGGPLRSTYFKPPVPLDHQESWTHYSAMLDFAPEPRSIGHDGIIVRHFGFDGGMFSSGLRRMRQHHTWKYSQMEDRARAEQLEQRDWIIGTLCGAHVCHNATSWAVGDRLEDKKRMQGAYTSLLNRCEIRMMMCWQASTPF